MLIIALLTLLNINFTTLANEEVKLEKYDNYILVVVDGPSCKDCLVELNKIIQKDSKIKNIMALKSHNNIISNKSLIKAYKKLIEPDEWIFYDAEFSEFNQKLSPNVILKLGKDRYVFKYSDLFGKPKEQTKIKELANLYKQHAE